MKRVFGAWLFVFAMGCGSTGSSAPTPTPTTDAGNDTAQPASSLRVVSWDLRKQPLSGTKFWVLDKTGVVLAEGTTGTDGTLQLSGVELKDEELFVVSKAANAGVEMGLINKAVAVSMRALFKLAEGDALPMFALVSDSVHPKLSGAATGVTDGNRLFAFSSEGFQFNGLPSAFSIRARKGVAGFIVATDYLFAGGAREISQTFGPWAKFEHPAITADTNFPLDLATAAKLTTKTIKFKVSVTGGDAGPLGGDTNAFAFATCGEAVPGPICGIVTKSAPTADKTAFDVELVHAEGLGEVSDFIARIARPDGASSERHLRTMVTEGQVVADFELPMPVTTAKQALSDPFSFEGAAPGSDVIIAAQKSNGESTIRVFVPKELVRPALQLPPLPAEILAALPATMPARLITTRDRGASDIPAYVTVSRAVTLTR